MSDAATPLSEDERLRALQVFANYPLLEQAQVPSVERLLGAAQLLRAPPSWLVLQEGAPAGDVWFLLDGVARIYHEADDGRQFTPKIMRAPNHFGDLERIAGEELNGQSVRTMTSSVLARVPWEEVQRVLLDDHAACLGWLTGIASQFVYTIDAHRQQVFGDLAARVANLLLSFAEAFGRADKEGVVIDHPLSRDGLAKQVGSVKRAVLRVVQDFEQRGFVASSSTGGMILKDVARMVEHTLPRRRGLLHRARQPKIVADE